MIWNGTYCVSLGRRVGRRPVSMWLGRVSYDSG